MSRRNLPNMPLPHSCRRLQSNWPAVPRYRCVALSLVLALACQSSLAQAGLTDWRNVQNLPPDSAISVKSRTGAKYHGKLFSVTADSLTIDSDERAFPGRVVKRRALNREDVQEVRLVAPMASLFAGGAIGAGLGAAIGVGLDSTAKSHESRGLIAGVLAVLGAAIGIALAHHHPFVKGKRIYVAP